MKNNATYVNLVLEGLLHILPLDLLRGGDQTTLRRPFVSAEHDSLDDLDALESVLLRDGLQVLQHECLYRG